MKLYKGPFADYLQEFGIVAQRTMPGTFEYNRVTERRNRTFIDMVRSMTSKTNLSEWLWGEASQTTVSIFNKDSSISTSKTPFDL